MNYFIQAITKNYFNFNDRARRAEFCYFVLFYFIISLALFLFTVIVIWNGLVNSNYPSFATLIILNIIFTIAIFLPTIAIMVRRFHDTGNSGLWTLIILGGAIPGIGGLVILGLNLFLMIAKGTEGKNQYGEDPRKNTKEKNQC